MEIVLGKNKNKGNGRSLFGFGTSKAQLPKKSKGFPNNKITRMNSTSVVLFPLVPPDVVLFYSYY